MTQAEEIPGVSGAFAVMSALATLLASSSTSSRCDNDLEERAAHVLHKWRFIVAQSVPVRSDTRPIHDCFRILSRVVENRIEE